MHIARTGDERSIPCSSRNAAPALGSAPWFHSLLPPASCLATQAQLISLLPEIVPDEEQEVRHQR